MRTPEIRFARALALMFVLLWNFHALGQIVTSFDPPVGSPGEQIVITGSGFIGRSVKVSFNGVLDSTARPTSGTIIYAHVPNGASTGPITVEVDGKAASSALDFTVVGLGPYLSSFSPEYGSVNETVIIYGWHLTNATAVKFAGKAASSIMPNAAGSQITTRVPAGATNGPITVTTQYGTSNTLDSFTVIGTGPYIASFDPPIGNGGDTVYLDGAHFTGVTEVRFNGKAAAKFFVQSDIRIQAEAPAGVSTGPISVKSSLGAHTNAQWFYVPPALTEFSPSSGRAGTNVTIRGSNLLGAVAVKFGGVDAAFITPTNNTNIIVTAPVGGITGPLRVITPAGSAQTTTNFNFPPTIYGFAPAFGAPGVNVAITGANLKDGTPVVKFGNVTATVSGSSFGAITCAVPAGAITGPISVTTTNGTFVTATNFFLPPVLSRISTNVAAPGSVLSVYGSNFLGTLAVTFNGYEAEFVPPTTNTLLKVTVPPVFTTGPIKVTTPAGSVTSTVFYATPIIYGFDPTGGVPGTVVTIRGTNFLDATKVQFNGLNASKVTITNNGGTIFAEAPANVTTGPISVTGPAGTATSAQPFVLDYVNDLSVSVVGPSGALFVGSNVLYQITALNSGPSVAANVDIVSDLPASVKVVTNYTSLGTATLSGSKLTVHIPSLATNQPVNIRLTGRPEALGQIVNSVVISGPYEDPVAGNNSSSVTNTVLPLPLLSIRPYSETQWKVMWPTALSDYVLQHNHFAQADRWSNVLSAPLVDGTNRFVIEAATGAGTFYRLKK